MVMKIRREKERLAKALKIWREVGGGEDIRLPLLKSVGLFRWSQATVERRQERPSGRCHIGAAGRYCPVCKRSSRKFAEFGVVARQDARCIYCGSLERHRLTWLYFTRMTKLFDGNIKRMLHVAPEPVFERLLQGASGSAYLTGDLHNPRAMIKLDITDIRYPDDPSTSSTVAMCWSM